MKERQGNLVDDFKIIYDSDEQADHLICNYCGERVERGMVSCSEHGDTCKVNSLTITAQNNWEKAVLNSWSMKKSC